MPSFGEGFEAGELGFVSGQFGVVGDDGADAGEGAGEDGLPGEMTD